MVEAAGMTATEFLEWERRQPGKHEFHSGEVFAMAGASLRHNALAGAVLGLLYAALPRGCRPLPSDTKVALADDHFVCPDAAVLCGEAVVRAGTTDVLENPTAVVEVLSKGTEAYDRGEKWSHYQRLASLRDYVLVSQSEARVEHFSRGESGWHYREARSGQRVVLASGATLDVDALFAGVFDLPGE